MVNLMQKLLILFSAILLVSCSPIPASDVAGQVNLNDLQPLPTPEGYEAVPLRVAVVAGRFTPTRVGTSTDKVI